MCFAVLASGMGHSLLLFPTRPLSFFFFFLSPSLSLILSSSRSRSGPRSILSCLCPLCSCLFCAPTAAAFAGRCQSAVSGLCFCLGFVSIPASPSSCVAYRVCCWCALVCTVQASVGKCWSVPCLWCSFLLCSCVGWRAGAVRGSREGRRRV